MNLKSAKSTHEYLNKFTTWLADQKEVADPNPKEEERIGWVKILCIYEGQKKTNMLSHLFGLTRLGEGIVKRRKNNPSRISRRQSSEGVCRDYKAMDWKDYLLLLRHEQDMRNLMLWLLLGAGGLRVSEVIHLFISDVHPSRDGGISVDLADPRYGKINVPTSTREKKVMTRDAYLRERFGLKSRDQYKPRSSLYAGWKGMRNHDGKSQTAQVTWMHPDFGRLAASVHGHYLAQRRISGPDNPYYFVNTKRNKGKPLTIGTVESMLKSACRRLNIQSAQNPHSLRHLYGSTLHNLGGADISQVQVVMRHQSAASTEIYTRPTIESVREAIKNFASLRTEQDLNIE